MPTFPRSSTSGARPSDDEYLFGLDSSNRLTFAWQTTGGNVWGRPSYKYVSGNAQVPLGTWTYITVVRNGPAISFYVNGNLDATFAPQRTPIPSEAGSTTVRIGGQNRGAASRVLNGVIDEVRMYNQALTPAQIQGDMNAPIGKTALPTATYGFNEGSGTPNGPMPPASRTWEPCPVPPGRRPGRYGTPFPLPSLKP